MEKFYCPLTLVLGAASLLGAGACKSDPKELAPKVKGYVAGVADLEACVASATHPDFLTSVVFGRGATSATPTETIKKCEQAYDERMATFADTGKRLGVKPKLVDGSGRVERPQLDDLDDVRQLQDLCSWVQSAHDDLEALTKATGQPAPKRPECWFGEPYKRRPPMLDPIGGMLSLSRFALPEVALRAQTPAALDQVIVFYKSTERNVVSIIGTSLDGNRIETVNVHHKAVAVAPAPKGFVALVRPTDTGPVELQVNAGSESSPWNRVGTLPARDYTQVLAAASHVTAVGAPTGQPHLVDVLRSTDGGKKFGAPIRVRDNKDTLWSDVRVERDGAVVALGATAAAFSVVRLEPTSSKPREVAQLPFKESIKDGKLAMCRGRDTYFVLADHRWLLGSNDAGKTWRDVADLGTSAAPRAVYCVADRVLVTTPLEAGIELSVCGPSACEKPVTVDRQPARLLFARSIGKDLELWFDDTSRSRSAELYGPLVWVYRWSNGVLVPDRFHLLPDDRNHGMTVLFANLDNTIGWLDPRSGLGDQPWRNGPEP